MEPQPQSPAIFVLWHIGRLVEHIGIQYYIVYLF
jgi:hypothetical protein